MFACNAFFVAATNDYLVKWWQQLPNCCSVSIIDTISRLQVNDLPDFLSGKDRERCQHIRILYVTEKPARKRHSWLSRGKKDGLPVSVASSRRTSHCPSIADTFKGKTDNFSFYR